MNLRLNRNGSIFVCEIHNRVPSDVSESSTLGNWCRWKVWKAEGINVQGWCCVQNDVQGPSRETAGRLNGDMSQQADRSERTFSFSQPHLPSFSRRAATMSQFIWGQMVHSPQVIAGHCVSYLFIFNKRAEMASGLSGVGDNHRMMHFTVAVLRCTWTKMLEMDPEDVQVPVIWQNHCCFILK